MSDSAPRHPLDATQEKAMGEGQDIDLIRTFRQRVLTVGVNVLVLAELTVAIYMASRTPDTFTPTFYKVFFTLLTPTLVCSWIARRLLARSAG